MEDNGRVVKIAGRISVVVGGSNCFQKEKTLCAIKELHIILRSFFWSCRPNPIDHAKNEMAIVSMLEGAKIKGGILTISFPRDIRKKLLLRRSYKIQLKKGEPSKFYGKRIAGHIRLCNCCIKATKELSAQEINWASIEIRKVLLRRNKQHDYDAITIVKVNLSKIGNFYNARVKIFGRKDSLLTGYEFFDQLIKDVKRFI